MTDLVSVKQVLTERRNQLTEDRTFDLDLPGYEHQGVVVRYRPLDYATTRAFGIAAEKIKPASFQEIRVASDTLVTSCIDLLIRENDELISLGQRLNVQGARELFGIDLPDGAPARDALAQIVPDTNLIIVHFASWIEASQSIHDEVQENIEDLSQASLGISPGSQQA